MKISSRIFLLAGITLLWWSTAQALTINSGETLLNNPAVQLNLSPPANCYQIQVQNESNTPVTSSPSATMAWDLSTGDGLKLVNATYYYTYQYQCGSHVCGSHICGSYSCGIFSTCYYYCDTYCPDYCTGNATSSESAQTTLDQTQPTLTISTPVDNSHTTNQSLSVTGTTSDLNGIKDLLVGGTSFGGWGAGLLWPFGSTVSLTPGSNLISVISTDNAGNSNTVTRTIFYDPPVNGTCGTSNGGSLIAAPASNLCATGTPTMVNGHGPWTWNCVGLNEGTTAACTANIASDVLVAGGMSSNSAAPPTAEVFHQETGTWSSTSNTIAYGTIPTNGICGANMTLLGSGKALIAGGGCGGDNGTTTNATSLYDPATNLWSTGAPMDYGRNNFGLVTLANGDALAFAGCSGGCSGPNVLWQNFWTVGGTAQIYSTTSNNWTTKQSLNTLRAGLGNQNTKTVTLQDGKVLVCGGNDAFSTTYTSCEIYDPSANTWTPTAGSYPELYGPTGLVLLNNGKVLAAFNYSAGAVLFDPVARTWSATGAPLSVQNSAQLVKLSDGRVLMTGGYVNNAGTYTTLATAQIYDPTSGTWTATGPMSIGRFTHFAVLLGDGKVLAGGGVTGSTTTPWGPPVASAEIFDPATGIWTPTGSMTQARWNSINAVRLPTIDTTAPVVTFTLPANASSTTVSITTLTATDNIAVTGYCLSETDSSDGCTWKANAPSTYTFASDGVKTLYAFARDAAGNISSSASATINIQTTKLLTINKSGSGTGSVTTVPGDINCGASCSASYAPNTTVNLTAQPDSGSVFVGWNGDPDCSDGTVTMDMAKSCSAVFEKYAFSASPASFDFGSKDVGDPFTSSRTFTITNVRNVYRTIQSISLMGADSGDFFTFDSGCAGNFFGPTGWCTQLVRFAPLSAGAKHAVLRITCDDPLTPVIDIPLQGTGVLAQRTLSITKTGSGNGTVTSSPAGINCGATCSALFPGETAVVLFQAPASNSGFSSWGNGCSGTGDCAFSMSTDRSVTANFTLSPLVKNQRTGVAYNLLQTACNEALHNDTIMALATLPTAPLILDAAKSLSIEGGYASDYATCTGMTPLFGPLTVKVLTKVSGLAIRPVPSTTKAITAFSFASPTVSGVVNEETHSIVLTVPSGTDVTALVPMVVHTGESISPASGTLQDFTNPVTYTVTAEDLTTQTYTVTVTAAP